MLSAQRTGMACPASVQDCESQAPSIPAQTSVLPAACDAARLPHAAVRPPGSGPRTTLAGGRRPASALFHGRAARGVALAPPLDVVVQQQRPGRIVVVVAAVGGHLPAGRPGQAPVPPQCSAVPMRQRLGTAMQGLKQGLCMLQRWAVRQCAAAAAPCARLESSWCGGGEEPMCRCAHSMGRAPPG